MDFLFLKKLWYYSIRSDEGLTLETSAFSIFHGGNSTFINAFDKTKFLLDSEENSQGFIFTISLCRFARMLDIIIFLQFRDNIFFFFNFKTYIYEIFQE